MLIKDNKCTRLPLTGGYAPNTRVELQIRSRGWGLVCGGTLKARSMQPGACLDLLYLDGGPHPAQSLQSVGPGMSPLTAILPWNNGELFEKGWQNQHAVCGRPPPPPPPPLLWALWIWIRHVFNASKRRWQLSDARFNPTFGRLCVQGQEPPSQRNHL